MEFKEIAPVRLYESVIEQIVDLIKNNELKPGDKLPPERELAEKLSISSLLPGSNCCLAKEIYSWGVTGRSWHNLEYR